MSVDAVPQSRSGLLLVWDTLSAPKGAFEALRERPRWLWAFVLTAAVGMVGSFLVVPAGEHIATATIAHQAATDPNMAGMSPAKIRQITDLSVTVQRVVWVFYPLIVLIAIALAALVLLVGNAISRGSANFARLFSLAANVAIINFGVGYLIVGILVALRGPEDFTSQSDVLRVVPSLAWLAPGAAPKLLVFLGTFNPFQIWSFALLALGLRTIAGLRAVPSYVIAAIVTFGGVLFAVPFAR